MSLLARLESIISGYSSAVVALSGGVDSALVAAVAARVLGDRAVAVTALSPTLPEAEAATAVEVARLVGITHQLVSADELSSEGYRRNAGDRCYFCKSELFRLTEHVRAARMFAVVADGTLPEDLTGHRPGLRAASEHQVHHPLVEAGATKDEVRAAARSLGLPVWDKPSFACLGSRFPRGTEVTLDKVRRVGAAEAVARSLGLGQVRVRWHEVGTDVLARVEVVESEFSRFADPGVRNAVVRACKDAGFRWVTVDLVGYGQTASVS